MKPHDHLVEIDDQEGVIYIYRVVESIKEKVLYTKIDMQKSPDVQTSERISNLSSKLGECILLDSPRARKILNL